MINFNFPEGYSFNFSIGIMAFPNNCWAVGITKRVDRAIGDFDLFEKSLIIRPTGIINEIDLYFRYISLYSAGGINRIECVGNTDELKNTEIEWMEYILHGYKSNVVSSNMEVLNPSKVRFVNGSYPYESREPEGFSCVCCPIHKYPSTKSNEHIIRGLLPDNPGIGFRRGNGYSVFINPDESKEWERSCLSIDELTCLAIHKTGGCIIDNPV